MDKKIDLAAPKDIGEFYNETTDKFLEVYGEIIQAFRTNDVSTYLNYTLQSMRVSNGMKMLDAGCGVGGPAIAFAKQWNQLSIDAISISEVQIKKALKKVEENKLQDRILPKHLDYHLMNEFYEKDSFDRVYFLESFGHSHDKKKLLNAAWDVLKPGGMIYIKDLFAREVEDEWEQEQIDKICGEINQAYKYNIADLYEVLSVIRRKGYILHFVKIPEVETDEFENLSISNEFQNLFDIGKIDSWDNYVFPIDFFEILAEKPKFNLEKDRHLYLMNQGNES